MSLIIIKDREDFRPRDWAVRIALSYGEAGWGFKPHISASTDGLLIDDKLELSDPIMYKWVLEFAKDNQLEVSKYES